ncbi:NmrA/HSCARG family protein [Kribbella deserti]|uniref:NmrA/HSCARG family protein n=1 Tax=Kribbella deserti TaxID=1926257 RepID=A0ABV6QEZ1_9ACTN
MSEQKIIAVAGATGSQGGGLVRAILADPERRFAVRALTRNPAADKAQALAALGAEVVQADLDDEASVRKAFDGAYGAYVVTNYWQQPSKPGQTPAEMELEQAGVAARAAKDAGIEHLIWSTLEDTREHFGDDERVPTVEATYKVPHFDAKGEANELFTDLGVPTTFLQTTFYFDAFKQGLGPARGEDGNLVLGLPAGSAKIAGIASEDIGKTAFGIFARGPEFIGETVSIAGEHLTGQEFAETFSAVLGEQVDYRPPGFDEYRALGFPGAVEFGNMFQFYVEDAEGFIGRRDLDLVRKLNPELQAFRTWLEANKSDLPIS